MWVTGWVRDSVHPGSLGPGGPLRPLLESPAPCLGWGISRGWGRVDRLPARVRGGSWEGPCSRGLEGWWRTPEKLGRGHKRAGWGRTGV